MRLSQAAEGFWLAKSVKGLSKRTLETYQHQLDHLAQFLGDPELEAITKNDIRRFFDYLAHEYKPRRWNGDDRPLSRRTIKNYWICLKSFWTWAVAEFGALDVMQTIPAPKVGEVQTEAFKEDHIKAMLKVAQQGRQGSRNVAIILTLLDTGIRSSELCGLEMCDLDIKNGKLVVIGKGDKQRRVYLGVATRKALWRYLMERKDRDDPGTPLFATRGSVPMQRHWLRELISNIGEMAGVKDAHPHRFRHTFAITYLRNRGDILTLQRLLGHSSLAMVRHYARIADVDAERVHRTASPVDNWLRGNRHKR
jgi:integrase/recombinase XerD